MIKKWANEHLPLLDWDKDRFSDYAELRGFDWRGKDCKKFNKNVYPGRKKSVGRKGKVDYNCNGIKGKNSSTGTPYKNQFCDNTN